jgi:short-subunit dehydrogenase
MARRAIAGLRGILTGASSGIGRALAAQLVREGAKLVLMARRRDRLEELAGELEGSPGAIELVAGDVADTEVRQAALARAQAAFGGLDLVVNNAGIGAMGPFAEATPERLRQVMEVNFFAAAELARAAIPLLRAGRRPIIVNISSVLGHVGVPGCAEYCASKFAMQGLSESLRAELARDGIDVLVVSPSTTQTEFFDRAIDARKPNFFEGMRGWPSERVARAIVRAIRRGKREILVGPGAKALVWSGRLFPGIVAWVLARR